MMQSLLLTCTDISSSLLKYSKANIAILIVLSLISSFILVGGLFFLYFSSYQEPSSVFFQLKIYEVVLYFLLAAFMFVSSLYIFKKLDKVSFKNMLMQALADRKKVYWQNVGLFISFNKENTKEYHHE